MRCFILKIEKFDVGATRYIAMLEHKSELLGRKSADKFSISSGRIIPIQSLCRRLRVINGTIELSISYSDLAATATVIFDSVTVLVATTLRAAAATDAAE